MEYYNSNLMKNIELLKLYMNSYKNHYDWLIKLFILYFAIIGTSFGFIVKIESDTIVTFLYLIIIISSFIFIIVGILMKIWMRKFINGIKPIEKILNNNLTHLFYPAKVASYLLLASCSILLMVSIFLYYNTC